MTNNNEFAGTFSGGPTELNGGEDQAEQAARAAQDARTQASSAAHSAVSQADRAVEHGIDEAGRNLGRARASADKITGQANEQLNEAMNVAGQQLHTAAQQVRQIVPEGPAAEIAGRTAEFLERGGSYLQSSDPNTALSDIETLIRRYPLQALAVGLGIGFLIGRSGK